MSKQSRVAVGVSAAAVLAVSAASATHAASPVARAASPAAHAAAATPAPPGPWDAYNLAPASRTVKPAEVFRSTGKVTDPQAAIDGKPTTLAGKGASVTYDFGKEVGGFVSLGFASGTTADGSVGLTYSESSRDVDVSRSDASNGDSNDEPAVEYDAAPGGTIDTGTTTPTGGTSPENAATPASQLRGGFRYLTVVNQTAGTVELDDVSVAISFDPSAKNLRDYPNYFYSSDEMLNRIWYAGAYTVQTNTIANDQGRVWNPAPQIGWNNSATIGEDGDTVIVDGAKRDRTVWPGDLGISVPSHFASLGDLGAVRSSLQTLYNHQADDGAMPYAGPAVNFIGNSDAYHMWSLIGTATYLQYSGDKAWVDGIWPKYRKALDYILAKIGDDGLLNVTQAADWARTDSGGKNIEANAIMYHLLGTCQSMAASQGDDALAASCKAKAAALKAAVNGSGYWDAEKGLYRNEPGSTLLPQDGNSLAVWYGLTDTDAQRQAISKALEGRWTKVGALTPEKSAQSVHPFPGSMEVMAHLTAGDDTRALQLMRLEWGFMLDTERGTKSTFWEGYRTDGSSDYSGSYQSLAHGWSTGPTSALTFYVLGIDPDPSGAPSYQLVPHPGDLSHAEGQLTTPGGVVKQSWKRDELAGTFSIQYDAPEGVVSRVGVPTFGRTVQVSVDGTLVWDGTQAVGGSSAVGEAGYVYIDAASGTHAVTSGPVPAPAPPGTPAPPAPPGTPVPPRPPAPPQKPVGKPSVGSGSVGVSSKRQATVRVRCGRSTAVGRCHATLSILRSGRSVGRRTLSIKADRTTGVRVRIDARTYRSLKRHGRLRATVGLRTKGADGRTRTVNRKVWLRVVGGHAG